ncbi:MAG: alpha/beta hydrolase family protein [Caulobacteraceae bacterium]
MRKSLAGLASVAVSFLAWCASAAAEPPSIADFMAESPLVDFALSPDGEHLAVLVDTENSGRVNVLNARSRATEHTIQLATDMRPMWVTWANQERLLIAVIVGRFEITSSRITFPSARVLAIDPDGENLVALFENQRNVLRSSLNLATVTDMLPDDPAHVLMPGFRGGDLDLWKVNVYSGAAERVATGGPDTFAWRTDAAGAPAFRYDVNRRGTMLRIYAPDAGGNWRRVATVRQEDLPEFQPVAVGPEPGLSYVLARPDGADRTAVYLYDLHQGQFTQTVASDPRVDIAGVFVNPRTSEYLGYFTFDDVHEAHFTDAGIQSHVNALRRFFGVDASFAIMDMSDNANMWIISASGPSDPGALYLYDRDRAEIEPLVAHRPSLAGDQLGASRVVRYAARDGVEITGYLTLPPGAGAGPFPLVLMPHGGPEVRDLFIYDRDAQFLATRGYAVFRPNFRGSSGYGRAFAEAGYGEWGGRMQDDLTDAVAHLVSTGVADPARVCIMGISYGGYAALAGAAFTRDTYRCAISIAGVSDLVEQSRYVLREGDDEEDAYIRRSIGDPRIDRDRLMARSPAAHAGDIDIPVLLLHGDQDSIVQVEHSRRMERALRQAGGNVRYVEVAGEGHPYWSDEDQTTLYTEVETFLARHLPVDAP